MNKEKLGIDDWLELIKKDKNLNGAYISISQYVYLTEQENQELKKQLEEKDDFINKLQETKNKLDKWDYKNTLQQAKFIKYLEHYIQHLSPPLSYTNEDEVLVLKLVLQKYKEIIGDDK